MKRLDVLIVGGGPIGLAAAIEARLAGLSAAVIEPRDGPIDKACGEGLMPGAVSALERLGVSAPGYTLAGIRYVAGERVAGHAFRRGPGRGVRRTTLHAALADRADALGVQRVRGRVDALQQDAESVTAGGIRAHWLLGCDGLHSRVAALAGLEVPGTPGRRAVMARDGSPRDLRRFGLRRHYALAPWSAFVEVHWLPEAEVYVTPVAGDLVGVAVLGPAHSDFAAAVAQIPQLSGAQPATSIRGAGPLRRRTRGRTAGRVVLVGDASGYVDAITGEGIRVGLAQARAAVACLLAGDPARYEVEWRRATRDFRMLTGGLVAAATSPLRPAIVPLARALPAVYGSVVERLAR